MIESEYRPEIDGLRALSLLAVIGFHAEVPPLSGGYIGVDVFFVISGYLITRIILNELKSGRFSFGRFYERRARRILPAMVVVGLACLPAAWIVLFPNEMVSFAHGLMSMLSFSANVYYWIHDNYFAPAMELNPLVHTWSLSVEEQYYLLFPFFLAALWRSGAQIITLIVSCFAIGSLALAQWGTTIAPTASFYLLPTRAWEILLGALCALYLNRQRLWAVGREVREILCSAGLLMVAMAALAFDRMTPTPSALMLVPTLGAALLILYSPGTTVARILSGRHLVHIGLISYSAYLWHQPVLAFARNLSPQPLQPWLIGMLFLMILAMAHVTWHFVETPFRNRERVNGKAFLVSASVAFCAMLSFGLAVQTSHGFPKRWTAQEREYIGFLDYRREIPYREGRCFLRATQGPHDYASECAGTGNGTATMIWGDSHAAALAYGMNLREPGIQQYTSSGCPPLINQERGVPKQCSSINSFVLSQVRLKLASRIVMHANWHAYNHGALEADLLATIDKIHEVHPSAQIVIVASVPHWSPNLPARMIFAGVPLVEGVRLINIDAGATRESDEVIFRIGKLRSVIAVSPRSALCENDRCLATVVFNGRATLAAWDDAHLTAGGSWWLSQKLW